MHTRSGSPSSLLLLDGIKCLQIPTDCFALCLGQFIWNSLKINLGQFIWMMLFVCFFRIVRVVHQSSTFWQGTFWEGRHENIFCGDRPQNVLFEVVKKLFHFFNEFAYLTAIKHDKTLWSIPFFLFFYIRIIMPTHPHHLNLWFGDNSF